jgi:hypothetical protein
MNVRDFIKKYWVVAPLPTLNYTAKYLDPFMNASWDFSKQAPILLSVYGDTFGANGSVLVAGSWFLTVIAMVWIRSENVLVPMMLTVILGNVVLFVPGLLPPEWTVWVILLVILIPVGAILYSFIKGR